MDANRTNPLAQNGVPGEYIACTPLPLLRQYLSANPASTMQRRDSLVSIDSITREKAETHAASAPREGVRSALPKVAHRLSGAGKEKQLTGGQVAAASGSVQEHEPFQVYVVGDQVVYLGSGSNRRSRKANEKQREEVMNDEIERVKLAKERRMSSGHWDDGGVAADARVMRGTS